MIKGLLLVGLAFTAASPAFGQAVMPVAPVSHHATRADTSYIAGSDSFGRPNARESAYVRLRSTLRNLRAEALALRAANGGTLTPEHYAVIQARLDGAQAAYRPYRSAPW